MRGDFVQYYSVKVNSLDDKSLELFKEMSLKLDSPDYSDLSDNFFKPEYVDAYLKTSELLETISLSSGKFKVYKWFSYLLFLSKENYLAARIEFVTNDNGIKMTSIEVARPFKGLMKSIFLEYLLPKYKSIESDNVQTVNAFMFYKKLAMTSIVDKHFKMFINFDDSRKEEITDVSQMDVTYGEAPDKFSITYILEEKT
jgi:hypothetical protein